MSGFTLLSKEEGARFVDIARSTAAYQAFSATLGDRFTLAKDVAVVGNDKYVVVTFAYEHNGQPLRAAFMTLIDRATSAVQQTTGFSLEDVEQGYHTLIYANGQLLADGIQNAEGTFISGSTASGVSLAGQNRVAEGERILQQYQSTTPQVSPGVEQTDNSFLDCMRKCMTEKYGVPTLVASLIGTLCNLACQPTAPWGACFTCMAASLGTYGWVIAICAGHCGCWC